MRLPGFPHLKDGSRGELVQLLFTHDSANYSDAEFQGALTRALMARCQSESLAAKPDRSALPPHLQQRNRPRITEQALEGLGDCSPDWSQGYGEGHRNNECAKRAGSCLARGMSEEDTFSKCLQWDAEHNDPPLGEVEVRATVASIAKTACAKSSLNAGKRTTAIDWGVAPQLDPVSGEELLSTTATPREWLVERFIPARETTMLGGDGGTGKTTLALQLSVAGITGSEWFGLKVTPCKCFILALRTLKTRFISASNRSRGI